MSAVLRSSWDVFCSMNMFPRKHVDDVQFCYKFGFNFFGFIKFIFMKFDSSFVHKFKLIPYIWWARTRSGETTTSLVSSWANRF